MRTVLSEVCDMAQFNKGAGRKKGAGLHLRKFILEDSEWDIIEQLLRLLSVRRPVLRTFVPSLQLR